MKTSAAPLAACIALVALGACQQSPPAATVGAPAPLDERVRSEIRTVAVVAQSTVPDVTFVTASRGTGRGVARGAGRGAAEGAAGGLMAAIGGGPVGILLLPVLVPAGAVLGAVVGGTVEGIRAVPERSAAQAETDIRQVADQAELGTCLQRAAAEHLQAAAGRTVVSGDGPHPDAEADAVLELGIDRASFAGTGGSTPDLRLLIVGHARIRMARTREVVFEAARLTHVSPQRPHAEWAQAEAIRAELDAACRQFARAAVETAFVEAR